jgi:hypothetical protein
VFVLYADAESFTLMTPQGHTFAGWITFSAQREGPATLTALGQRLGVPDPQVETKTTCVDPKRQWRHAGNVWQNSMTRSMLQTVSAPVTGRGRARHRSEQGHDQQAAEDNQAA